MNQITATPTVLNYSAQAFGTYVENLSGPQLATLYNEMLAFWQKMGGDNTFGSVKRFADATAGKRRCVNLHNAIWTKGLKGETTETHEPASAQAGEGTPAVAEETTATSNPAPAETTAQEEQTPAPTSGDGQETATDEESDMAKRKKAAAKGKSRPRSTSGTTIRELTDEYNKLVAGMGAKAKEAAPYARHHKSLFESKAKAEKQLKRLRKDLGK